MNGPMDQGKQGAVTISLSPFQVFGGGLLAGLLVLCTLGFFVTLPMVLKGASFGGSPSAYVPGPTPSPSYAPEAGAPAVLAPVDEKTDHIVGNKNAKVTIVEYSDFECPFCGRFHPTIKEALAKYGKDIRVVYRHFPLTSIHPQAQPAAEASECAAEQGKFWEFADKLFANQGALNDAYYKSAARELGLNGSKFDSCVSSRKYQAKVEADIASGNAAGVQGTPHSIIIGANGQQYPISGALPFASVEATIQQALNS